jgi:hypothetical protein
MHDAKKQLPLTNNYNYRIIYVTFLKNKHMYPKQKGKVFENHPDLISPVKGFEREYTDRFGRKGLVTSIDPVNISPTLNLQSLLEHPDFLAQIFPGYIFMDLTTLKTIVVSTFTEQSPYGTYSWKTFPSGLILPTALISEDFDPRYPVQCRIEELATNKRVVLASDDDFGLAFPSILFSQERNEFRVPQTFRFSTVTFPEPTVQTPHEASQTGEIFQPYSE